MANQESGEYSGPITGGQGSPGVLQSAANIPTAGGLLSLASPTALGSEWTLSVVPADPTPTPEPLTSALTIAGLLAIVGCRLRERRHTTDSLNQRRASGFERQPSPCDTTRISKPAQ